MNVIFLGPPGSGKGTMAKRVAECLGLEHISTGDMLREEVKRATNLGKEAEGYMNQGLLVPDDVIMQMIQVKFRDAGKKGGAILDGFPRTVKQAEGLDLLIDTDAVINLGVDVEVIVDRVLSRRVCKDCGAIHSTKTNDTGVCDKCDGELITRADDNEETIRERFRVYEKNTKPLIDYYNQRGIVTDVDATMPIDEEAAFICNALKSLQ